MRALSLFLAEEPTVYEIFGEVEAKYGIFGTLMVAFSVFGKIRAAIPGTKGQAAKQVAALSPSTRKPYIFCLLAASVRTTTTTTNAIIPIPPVIEGYS